LRKIEQIVRERNGCYWWTRSFNASLTSQSELAHHWWLGQNRRSFQTQSRTGKDYALGQSHEEIITPLAKELINSYKDLPLALYQIQWKYRDELRSKSGICEAENSS
jgi:prolyl-tRNA synthetase